jgi:hypothetical protein
MVTLFVGYTTAPRPDWADYAPEFKAPSNYKDEIKIAEYIFKARQKFTEEAGEGMLTGMLATLAAYKSDDKKQVGLDGLTRVAVVWPDKTVLGDIESQAFDRLIIGGDRKQFFRLALSEYFDRVGGLGRETAAWVMEQLSPEVWDETAIFGQATPQQLMKRYKLAKLDKEGRLSREFLAGDKPTASDSALLAAAIDRLLGY